MLPPSTLPTRDITLAKRVPVLGIYLRLGKSADTFAEVPTADKNTG
jgi:hypothetical protein